MHSKKPLFFALAMCLSFTAILSFMLVLSTPDPRPKRKRTAARQSVVKPTPQKSRLLAAQERRKAKHCEKTPASSPTKQAALPQTPPAAPTVATAPVAKMDQAAVQGIQKLKRDSILKQLAPKQAKRLNRSLAAAAN